MTDKIACCPLENQTRCKEEAPANQPVNYYCFVSKLHDSNTYLLNWFWRRLSYWDGLKVFDAKIQSVEVLCEFIAIISMYMFF